MSTDPRTKDYIAREGFRALRNPRVVPAFDDLRPERESRHITQTAAAQHFSVWPTAISRIEKGILRDHDFSDRYRQWLSEQPKIST